jgi:coenzyme F420-reducing hydrogenase gamma subunit
MKSRCLISILLVLLVSSCAGCNKNIANEITLPTVTQTVPITTSPITAVSNTTIPETSVIVTETTISNDQAMEDYKSALKKSLSLSFGAELTEFAWGENKTKIIMAYNSKNTTETLVKKEMYDIAKSLTDNGWFFNADLELDAATGSGENFQSITKLIDMKKLENLELPYDDWLKVAFK